MSRHDKLSVDTRLSIVENGSRDEGTLGKGVYSLLQGIIEFGSLNKAAKNLGMAYSKAWRIVKETEAGFGMLLINRDGARGSTLTEDGKHLVEVYKILDEEATEFVNRRFRELI